MTPALLPSRRAVRLLDAVIGASVVVSVGLGVLTGVELARLATLGVALQDAASALERTGRALGSVAGVPVIGGQVGQLAEGVVTTAADVRSGAVQAVGAVQVLAIVVGIAVALVPVPLLAAYLPFRVWRARALRELRQLVGSPRGVEPGLAALLAHRAVWCLPYARLRAVSADPWRDLAAGHHQRLAAAELERLGLAPPAGRASPQRAR